METRRKKTRKWILPVMLLVILSCVGCTSSTNNDTEPETNVSVDWTEVNEALSRFRWDDSGYYLCTDYETEETEFNMVSVTNYDADEVEAFKNVEYQLMYSYGETMILDDAETGNAVYDDAMIEISIIDNDSEAYYVAVYSKDGTSVAEDGEWFLKVDKEAYLNEKIDDSRLMFGLR